MIHNAVVNGRYFWISWIDGHIKVGQGYEWEMSSSVVDYQIPESDLRLYGGFHGVSLGTCCGATMRYEMPKDQGLKLMFLKFLVCIDFFCSYAS